VADPISDADDLARTDPNELPADPVAEASVSIVVAAYDAAATIGRTLESLLAQTFMRWEAIVVDDGSSDDTALIVASYVTRDSRIRLFRQPNAGPGAARNAGIRLARHGWLYFIDAHDWAEPALLARMTAALEADPSLDAVHCGWAAVADDGRVIEEDRYSGHGDLFPAFARRCIFALHACIVRRSLVEIAGGFDESHKVGEDWLMWQRVARLGARFEAVPMSLARCGVGTRSLSRDLDGRFDSMMRLIALGHGPDPQLPNTQYPNGRPQSEATSARLESLVWMAGAMLAQGRDPAVLLPRVERGLAAIYPALAAESIFRAVPLTLRRTRDVWGEAWPSLGERAELFLKALAAHMEVASFARAAWVALARRVLDQLAGSLPCIVGPLYGLSFDVAHRIDDVRAPSGVDRIRAQVRLGDHTFGVVELPACDGVVSAFVLRDAIADRFAWSLLGRFFERTLYRDVEFRPDDGGWTAWRGGRCVARALSDDPRERADALHDAIGWTAFMRELWGPLPLHIGALRRIRSAFRSRRRGATGSLGWLGVEASGSTPDPWRRRGAARIAVAFTVGGAGVAVVEMSAADAPDALALRRVLEDSTRFELCRVAVREGLVGVPWDHPGTLRDRLAAVAEQRRAPDRADVALGAASALAPGWQLAIAPALRADTTTTVIGRRGEPVVGGPRSRPATLPFEVESLAIAVERLEGTPVVRAGDGTRRALAYAPSLLVLPPVRRKMSPPAAQPSETSTPPAAGQRHEFESLFARADDPWRYTSAYEQEKYERTLSVLPSKPVRRALELACAEGHFTVQLARRVDTLVASDISKIALERAAVRCQNLGNVSFRHLDLVTDELQGPFDLVVVSEVLYYVGDREALRAIARKMSQALTPGGSLVTAHAHVLADDPDRTGFDWDVPFGARVIVDELSHVPGLRLVKELRTPLYRVTCFQADTGGPPGEILETDAVKLPHPDILRRVRWNGGTLPPAETMPAQRLPILMYHHVAPDGVHTDDCWRVTPVAFERQLEYLRDCGFQSVSLDAWRESVEARRALPGRPVAITFDDGYADFAEHAWPILRRYGFGAHMMLVSGSVGRHNTWDRGGDAQPLLDWGAIAQLRDEGVQFGSHSVTHRRMTALSLVDIAREAIASREEIERRLGEAVSSFAYPYGDEDDVVRHLVGAAGFEYGLTCRPGAAHRRDSWLALPRIEVSGTDDLSTFIAKLSL
jgi:peptidoglycan/xylan/chitin deacetylase (PgdA/CDA1 family)